MESVFEKGGSTAGVGRAVTIVDASIQDCSAWEVARMTRERVRDHASMCSQTAPCLSRGNSPLLASARLCSPLLAYARLCTRFHALVIIPPTACAVLPRLHDHSPHILSTASATRMLTSTPFGLLLHAGGSARYTQLARRRGTVSPVPGSTPRVHTLPATPRALGALPRVPRLGVQC